MSWRPSWWTSRRENMTLLQLKALLHCRVLMFCSQGTPPWALWSGARCQRGTEGAGPPSARSPGPAPLALARAPTLGRVSVWYSQWIWISSSSSFSLRLPREGPSSATGGEWGAKPERHPCCCAFTQSNSAPHQRTPQASLWNPFPGCTSISPEVLLCTADLCPSNIMMNIAICFLGRVSVWYSR